MHRGRPAPRGALGPTHKYMRLRQTDMLVLNAGRVENYEENPGVMKAPAVGLSIGGKRIVFKKNIC